MQDSIRLEIVTPERQVIDETVDEVVLPSVEGSMGVLPGHAPLLARLDPGEVSYRKGGTRRFLAISGGFAEVLRDSVSVLARTAEPAEEIDVERARRARADAEERLKGNVSEAEFRAAEVRLKRAVSRIQVHERL
jgi:F-type H+-transporting ATPase subunit epsilon